MLPHLRPSNALLLILVRNNYFILFLCSNLFPLLFIKGEATNLILEGVRPADGEMSADDRLRMAAAKVVQALSNLGASTSDPFSTAQENAAAVKAVNNAMQHQAALAKAIAAAKNNPELQR
jgi:hypothetical protein